MSELTPCNFCSLKRMRERAGRDGKEVVLRGNNAYVVKKGETVQTDDKPVAWFMALTNHCVC